MKTTTQSIILLTLAIGLFILGTTLHAQQPQLNFVQSALSMSYSLESKGDYKGALQQVQSVLGRQPDHYFCLMRSGWLNLCLGIYADSLQAYNQASRACPQAVEPLLGALKAAAALGDWKSVESLAKSLLEKDPNNYTGLSRVAYAYFMRKDYNSAAVHYSRILTLYPSDLDMRNGLAWSYYYQGRKSEAKAQFEEVLNVSPSNSGANQGIAAVAALK